MSPARTAGRLVEPTPSGRTRLTTLGTVVQRIRARRRLQRLLISELHTRLHP